ncbi:MAG: phosphoglucosamine mutase [Candidatus Pacebacteria bacterium]|nr:phosphoglucosamine mutase [Candidatus Paceibacterota bacterium]
MLITSISGIRGTIGGVPGENLTPLDITEFISAYGTWILKEHENPTICVGRDGRASGKMILDITIQTLISLGIDVINLDYATTPTVEVEVIARATQGGIIITASHNPKPYNGIKMLNNNGEFLSAKSGQEILDIKKEADYTFVSVDDLGTETKSYNHTKDHIQKILDLEAVDVDLIKSKKLKISLDAINSVGGIAVPILLEKLGCEVVGMYCEVNGDFQHPPEPLDKNLSELKSLVTKTESDLGIAVDPDVDRLVLIDEKGTMINEEYGLVMVSDYILSVQPGTTVSNLSSSRALRDITEKYKQEYSASAVGEKNVVEKMKEVDAVIGGEGSGGIIYPPLHYGRDALVGISLFLTHLAKSNISASELRKQYPDYFMTKEKIDIPSRDQITIILDALENQYRESSESISRIDGLKIDFENSWVHVRASNTEPILRIYTEAKTLEEAEKLSQETITRINNLL